MSKPAVLSPPTSPVPTSADPTTTHKKRRKKEKKEAIVISLWVNKVKYEFGILCTFCAKVTAIYHCPECPDFYCSPCDITTHTHKKRRRHVRTKLSLLTMDAAAKRVTLAVRYHGHLRTLQAKCRATFRRYFDRTTLNHYYFNPVYGTVSWRKPYCVRKMDLFPFLSPDLAAARVQTLYRLWLARATAISLLKSKYVKIFDRTNGKFYYGFKGKSTLISHASWKRPRYCNLRAYPKDILPIYTIDVACVIIQRKWRAFLIRQFLWALARASFHEEFDSLLGKSTYTRIDTGVKLEYKPLMLGNQPWNPNNVIDWTFERVLVFIRRIGLKQYVKQFKEYLVDGYTLLMLDLEDYENMDIMNRVHIRKIEVEINKIYKRSHASGNLREAHQIRREKIRKAKMFAAAASLIQAVYRGYRSRKELKLTIEISRVRQAEKRRNELIIERGSWWMEREIPQHLPAIKQFGRKRDHLSCNGWGHWEGDKWVPSFPDLVKNEPVKLSLAQELALKNNPTAASEHKVKPIAAPDLPPININLKTLSKSVRVMSVLNPDDPAEDNHPTRIFTNRLNRGGYDKRRWQKFKQVPVDIFIAQPILDSLNLDV